ncbi:MAG: hypothetical protein ACJ73U_38020, partial [Actinophytocola sp.]
KKTQHDEHHINAEMRAAVILTEQSLDQTEAATMHLDDALRHYDPAGDLGAETLNRFADALRRAGRGHDALRWCRAALAQARRAGERYQIAKARDGIAHLLYSAGHTDAAKRRWLDALALYDVLGVPEAQQVRDRLDNLSL